jgi:hypothetical protein
MPNPATRTAVSEGRNPGRVKWLWLFPAACFFILFLLLVFVSATDQHQRAKIGGWISRHDKEIELVSTPLVAIFTAAMVFAMIALCFATSGLRRSSEIMERAYVSGGGYFPRVTRSVGHSTRQSRADSFQLTVDNYGKTPAHVNRVEIGYSRSPGKLGEIPVYPHIFPLGAVVPPGKEGLTTDVKLHRSLDIRDNNTVVFGRFYYETIMRDGEKYSGFILRITDERVVLPVDDAPRAYTDWT